MKFLGFLCISCDTLFRINFREEQAGVIENIMRSSGVCPRCRKDGLAVTGYEKTYANTIRVTAQELWKAIHGLGLPGEEAQPDAVKHLLLNYKVVDTSVVKSGNSNRCVVESITVQNEEDTKTIHFAASGEGAAVFKVTTEEKSNDR